MSLLVRRALAVVLCAGLAATVPAIAEAAEVPKPRPKAPANPAKEPAKPAAPKKAKLIVCNHSGYSFGVQAYGAGELRRTDLGAFDECVEWALPGGTFQFGIDMRIPSRKNVLVEVRIKQDGYAVYRRIPVSGTTNLYLGAGKTTSVAVFIPRS